MWVFVQRTGELFDAHGELVGTGYAGMGIHKNRPESQAVKSQGPLPRGRYRIGAPFTSPKLGPYVLPLTPNAGNAMFGRSAFRIHGDSLSHPGAASNGCIIQGPLVRRRVYASQDLDLLVVAEHTDVPSATW